MQSNHKSAYQPRDVLNAPQIRQRITERSTARGDSDEIRAWLINHFYRHIIGNFTAEADYVKPLRKLDEIEALYPGSSAPDWLKQASRRLKSHKPVPADKSNAAPLAWWIAPDSPPLLSMENRLLEFLRSRQGTALEGKLQRINCPQALARWTLEHLEFEQRRESGLIEHQPEAVIPLLQSSQGIFVEFNGKSDKLRLEMAYESQMMQHCLGQFADKQALSGGYGGHYAEVCEKGELRLFSYRTGQMQPHITLSALCQHNGKLTISQIKGKQNRPPIERYWADVLHLLNFLDTDEQTPADALAIGIVRLPDFLRRDGKPAWCNAQELISEAEQLWLLSQHPALLKAEALRSPLAQWLVLARKDSVPDTLLAQMPASANLKQALQWAGEAPAHR